MLGEKMPDSPESKDHLGSPNGVALTSRIASVVQNSCNGNVSPTAPGRSPSPTVIQTSLSPNVFHRLEGNGLSSKRRQVANIKRFLSVLQSHASSISEEVGDRVHALILGLVSSTVTVEEFQQKIQDTTNYPFRPFAIPFLKTHLPTLQSEVLNAARLAKLTPQQYLRYHDSSFLERSASRTHQEPFEIFQSEPKESKKRSFSNRHTKGLLEFEAENGRNKDEFPTSKRHHTMSGHRTSPSASSSPFYPTGTSYRFDDPLPQCYRDSRYDRFGTMERDYYRPLYGALCDEDRVMEDEWRNIHTMLNCILGMVEKTKRALVILQHRSNEEKTGDLWSRNLTRHLDLDLELMKRPQEFNSHYKAAEDRVTEVRRRAENAVNEVKRQAVAELQKAVSAAETKAQGMVAAERLKMERLLLDARRQSPDDTILQQEESNENCWNCGRKAHETCGGCNVARYCGSFCQHKHWDLHHRTCNPTSSSGHTNEEDSPSSNCTLDLKTFKNDERETIL